MSRPTIAATIYNHKLVEGQLHGGLMQGIGQVFGEHIAYDPGHRPTAVRQLHGLFHAAGGHLAPITLIDCGVPSPVNPLGAKGAGEAGATGRYRRSPMRSSMRSRR